MDRITIRQVQEAVARHFGIEVKDLLEHIPPRKECPQRHAQMMAMYLAREVTGRSYPVIAKAFKRHHTTVIYAHKTMRHQMWEPRKYIAAASITESLEVR